MVTHQAIRKYLHAASIFTFLKGLYKLNSILIVFKNSLLINSSKYQMINFCFTLKTKFLESRNRKNRPLGFPSLNHYDLYHLIQIVHKHCQLE